MVALEGIVDAGAPSWAGAPCVSMQGSDLDQFFPEKGTAQTQARAAKKICNGDGDTPRCMHRDVCLEYALDRRERFGIWGGMSERERDRLRKGRIAEAEAAEVEAERVRAERRARRSTASKQAWDTRRRNGAARAAQAGVKYA